MEWRSQDARLHFQTLLLKTVRTFLTSETELLSLAPAPPPSLSVRQTLKKIRLVALVKTGDSADYERPTNFFLEDTFEILPAKPGHVVETNSVTSLAAHHLSWSCSTTERQIQKFQ